MQKYQPIGGDGPQDFNDRNNRDNYELQPDIPEDAENEEQRNEGEGEELEADQSAAGEGQPQPQNVVNNNDNEGQEIVIGIEESAVGIEHSTYDSELVYHRGKKTY